MGAPKPVDLIKLLLVDDHAIVCDAIATHLRLHLKKFVYAGDETSIDSTEFEIHQASNCADAIDCLQQESIRLVVLDLHLPDVDGVEALSKVRMTSPEVNVVVLSADTDPLIVKESIDLGANSFVPKKAGPGELLEAIKISLDGGSYLPESIVDVLARAADDLQPISDLTRREREVFSLLIKGRPNKLIGGELSPPITERTVKEFNGRIYEKFGVRGRSELLALVLARGLDTSLR